MFASTYNEYKGYYYTLNGKIFAGEKFNASSPELVKINSSNTNILLTNPSTYVYGKVSKVSVNNREPSSYYFNTSKENNKFRYFIKKHNTNVIKEISKETYDQFLNNPLYVSVSLFYNNNFNKEDLNRAEQTIPGITVYVGTLYAPGATD